jgi:hypothetical protein
MALLSIFFVSIPYPKNKDAAFREIVLVANIIVVRIMLWTINLHSDAKQMIPEVEDAIAPTTLTAPVVCCGVELLIHPEFVRIIERRDEVLILTHLEIRVLLGGCWPSHRAEKWALKWGRLDAASRPRGSNWNLQRMIQQHLYVCFIYKYYTTTKQLSLVPPQGNDPRQPESNGFTDRAASLAAYDGIYPTGYNP